ncbi:uncharacterized protein LOC141905269 [Tubulanus polymorphus]|uniref:uncharacterized protein LOC141905269 n=1 Tax=Tubulanus polymorphus TaxID=672921 RepID=UPI003DA32CDC
MTVLDDQGKKVRELCKYGESQDNLKVFGTTTEMFNKVDGKVFCEQDSKTTGDTSRGVKKAVFRGIAWNSCSNNWGYAKVFFHVGSHTTVHPSLVEGFGKRYFNSENPLEGYKFELASGNSDNSESVVIAEMRASNPKYGSDKWINRMVMFTGKTELIDVEFHWGQKQSDESQNTAKHRIIVNNGCGSSYVDGMTGKLATEESIETTTSTSLSETFETGMEISAEFEKKFLVATFAMSLTASFSYSRTSDISESKTETSSVSYEWPHYCQPGFTCEASIIMTNTEEKVPVTFTMKRGTHNVTKEVVWSVKRQSWTESLTAAQITDANRSTCKTT